MVPNFYHLSINSDCGVNKLYSHFHVLNLFARHFFQQTVEVSNHKVPAGGNAYMSEVRVTLFPKNELLVKLDCLHRPILST